MIGQSNSPASFKGAIYISELGWLDITVAMRKAPAIHPGDISEGDEFIRQ